MAEGRSDGSRDEPGTESYDWLYADPSRRTPPADAAEHTQVLRTRAEQHYREQGGAAPPPSYIAPGPGSNPPPSARQPAPSRTRGLPRFRLRWLVYVAVAWIVYLVAVPIYAWVSVSTVNAQPDGKRPADQPGTTYLVVGSDARKGLPGRRTDTIMLLHTGSGPNLLMSIPRDSLVPIPGHSTGKINAAFAYGGPKLLTQTIEQDTGIRVDHYVEIGFRGFVGLVDAVGGVKICPKTAMRDPLAELNITAGCQEADGATALGYARSRHTQALGDIGRAEHQREVVSAIGAKAVSPWTVLNPFRYWNVVTSGAQSVRVGKGTGPVAAAKFAVAMTHVNGKDGLTCGVPISDLAVHWDTERAPRLFKLIAQDRTEDVGNDLCQPSGLAQ